MSFKHAALIALACAAAAPTWAVNKCTVNGKVVYQDAPCADAKAVNLTGAGKADLNSEGANYWKREVTRQARDKEEQDALLAREQRVQAAIYSKKVFVGMTADEAIRSWGRPTKINNSVGSYGKHEQWVYDRGNYRSQYIYVENGVVTSMQSPD